jgi:hypothetical protein
MARVERVHGSGQLRGAALAVAAVAMGLLATNVGATAPPPGSLVNVSKSASAPPPVAGIGGPATCATLPVAVRGIAVASTGTVYFTDNNRVLKVDSGGTLSLVAGTGVAAFAGDNGSAKTAALSHPAGVGIDAKTGLYIADTGNNRVRRVFNGAISTVAGNGSAGASRASSRATSANLPAPSRVSTNGTGGLRIGNAAGGAYVNLNTKSFTPTRTHPRAFTVDPALATYGSAPPVAQVRRWANHATSSTNFAGRGSLHIGYSGDNGIAQLANLSAQISDVASDGAGNIYIDDSGNGAIRVVDHSTHIIRTLTGSGGPWAGQLKGSVLAVTPAGDVYASAVGGTQIVRRDHATGVVTLVAGSGNLHSGCPVPVDTVTVPGPVAAITHDGFANVIAVVDLPGNVTPEIWMISTIGMLTRLESNHAAKGSGGDGGPASAATFTDITGVDTDTPGNIYLMDAGSARVRRIDHTTHVITTVAGNGTAGNTGDNGPATSASIQGTLSVDSLGNLFIAGGGRIRRVDHTSHVITSVAGGGAVAPTTTGIPANTASIAPGLSTTDPLNSVYFMSGNRLYRYDQPVSPATIGTVALVAGNGALPSTPGEGDGGLATSVPLSVHNLAIGADENIYVTSASTIRRIGSLTHRVTTIYAFDPHAMLPGTWTGTSQLDALTLTGSDVVFGSSIQNGATTLDSEIRLIVDGADAPENLTPR